LVQNDFTNLINLTSGNEKIDNFIQTMQFDINNNDYQSIKEIVFEWIPYNQFNEIKKTGKNSSIIVYSAIWKNGPLYYDYIKKKYIRDSNKEIALKGLQDLQNAIEILINEV
jgi:hypothetical protein